MVHTQHSLAKIVCRNWSPKISKSDFSNRKTYITFWNGSSENYMKILEMPLISNQASTFAVFMIIVDIMIKIHLSVSNQSSTFALHDLHLLLFQKKCIDERVNTIKNTQIRDSKLTHCLYFFVKRKITHTQSVSNIKVFMSSQDKITQPLLNV